jgi:membrane-bound lytic murein transglycosylase MltF
MRIKIQIGIILTAILILSGIILWIRDVRSRVHDLPSIIESGRLSVLTDSSRLGFSVIGDSVSGFQYEIIKAFADSLGLELAITEENDFNACLKQLESGDYDVIASFIPITTEWQNEVLFTIPLLTSRQVLVQRYSNDSTKSIGITNQLQLANDSIYIPFNSPYKLRLKNLSDEIAEDINIFEIKNVSSEQLVRLVSEAKIKYTICDEQFARRLKLQFNNIDISLPLSFEQHSAWVVHPNSTLLHERLNAFLKDFIGSSAYWEIYRRYY